MTMRFGIDSDGWLYKLNAADGTPALHIRPLPQATTQPRILPWMWINHTQAASNKGSFQAAWNWWTSTASGGGEAHTVTNMDGEITQFMPFTRRADCSYKANSFFVEHNGLQVLAGALSDEAQDEGWGSGKPGTLCAYSPAQLETKAQVLAATHIKYGIPLDQVPAGPFDRGIGWHRLHAQWSKYVGKSCPGDARVAQQPELRARAQQIVAGGHPVVIEPIPPSEEDDMPASNLVLCIEDAQPPHAYYKSDGFKKVWVRDQDAKLQIDQRLAECESAPGKGDGVRPSPVDGLTYRYMRHGGVDVIASYGPIDGPVPDGHDVYGRH